MNFLKLLSCCTDICLLNQYLHFLLLTVGCSMTEIILTLLSQMKTTLQM